MSLLMAFKLIVIKYSIGFFHLHQFDFLINLKKINFQKRTLKKIDFVTNKLVFMNNTKPSD